MHYYFLGKLFSICVAIGIYQWVNVLFFGVDVGWAIAAACIFEFLPMPDDGPLSKALFIYPLILAICAQILQWAIKFDTPLIQYLP